MATVRNSKQRDAIRSYLLSTMEHPTAEVVYRNLKKEFPKISLGTVYRNLNFLVEHGEANRFNCGDGYEHFDGNTAPHCHFFCRRCGRIMDLEVGGLEQIDAAAKNSFGGTVEGHAIYFHGLCKGCKEL